MRSAPLKSKLSPFWLLQLCGWGAFGLSMFLATWVWVPFSTAFWEKGLFTLLGLGFSLPLRAIYQHVKRRNLALFWIISISAICAYISAMAWTASYSMAIKLITAWEQSSPFALGYWQKLFNGGLYHTYILLAWSLLYFGIKHYRELQTQTERALQAEALAQQAQLQALRYQINPHFLFNTLNAVSTLVAQNENAAANRMLARLSEFLRLTLDGSDAQEVPLAAELDYVQRYLDIEQVRMGDRLRVRYEIAPAAHPVLVPVMILQPLVENALRHSVAPREAGGCIEIVAHCSKDVLHLEVRDDGAITGTDIATLQPCIGLTNTRARLQQLYGAAHQFRLTAAASGGLVVQLELPLSKDHTL
jgi:two-component system, LytTR family, sensor kinase